jgi:hypothetical protein
LSSADSRGTGTVSWKSFSRKADPMVVPGSLTVASIEAYAAW